VNETVYRNIHATKHAGKIALVTGGTSGLGLATAFRAGILNRQESV
jgi:short-subunit dehydrogenase involved in D-alanine esterification of teichoic acids